VGRRTIKRGHEKKRVLSAPAAPLLVSIISVWELVFKCQARKLILRAGMTEVLDKILYHSPWTILPMTPQHLPVLQASRCCTAIHLTEC